MNDDAAQLSPLLERLRRRLLDLTGNNALLNYRHPKATSLRIVDEVPAQVFERLLENDKLSFASLDEPSGGPRVRTADQRDAAQLALESNVDPRMRAREERRASQARRDARRTASAAEMGVSVDFELPKVVTSSHTKHQDRKLQTLFFPDELEEQLRKIHRTATTSLEETGANRLHLLCGFIEWSEAGYCDSERIVRLAPLVLVPVALQRRDLDRDTNTYRYTLERTGEDWSANVTLQEKCRVDFGFQLPDMVDEDKSLEHYFGRVESLLKRAQPSWRLRRYLTLGLVSFGKVLMWRDLDPAKWPAARPIFSSTPLRELLGASREVDHEGAAAKATGEEYPLDQLDESPGSLPPTVIEADSSQHSALVDVERGLNLVLQGPPGTGKSQTITNLIAAAIKQGRKVLFVAEKKAALDVVFTRLEAAGLAEFCLPLHSHSSAKREFVAALGRRLALRDEPPSRPKDLEILTERLLAARSELARPLKALHEPFGAVKMTPYDIFWRARRLASAIPPDVLSEVQELRIQRVTQASQQTVAARRDLVDNFAGAFENVRSEGPTLDQHPWAGITNEDIPHAEVDDLLEAAHSWRTALRELEAEVFALNTMLGQATAPPVADLRCIAEGVQQLVQLPSHVPGNLPHRILSSTEVPNVRAAIDAVRTARERWLAIDGPWGVPGAVARHEAGKVQAALSAIEDRFGATDLIRTVREVASELPQLYALVTHADSVVRDLVEALGGVGASRSAAVGDGSAPLGAALAAALAASVREGMELDPRALALLQTQTADVQARARLEVLGARAAALRETRDALRARFQPSFRPPMEQLRLTATVLATAPRLLSWLLSGSYRSAVKLYRDMSGGLREDRETMLRDVRALVVNHDATREFGTDPLLTDMFGAQASGVDSPFDAALAAADWHAAVRRACQPLGSAGRDLTSFLSAASPVQWQGAVERAKGAGARWEAAIALPSLFDRCAVALRQPLSTLAAQSLAEIAEQLEALLNRCQAFLAVADSTGLGHEATLQAISERFARVQAAWDAEDRVVASASVLQMLDVGVAGASTEIDALEDALLYITRVEAADLPPAIEAWLLGPEAPDRLHAMRERTTRLASALARCQESAAPLRTRGMLDDAAWIGALGAEAAAWREADDPLHEVPVHLLKRRLDLALSRESALYPWAIYRRSRAEAVAEGLGEIVALVESERLARDRAGDAYEAAFFRNLSSAALREIRVLDAFDSGTHAEVRRRFARLDADREILTRAAIAAELARTPAVPGCKGPLVRDMTNEPLILHQAGLQKRHLAIRELFVRAGRAIQSLKPCFLMGPQAVAQYLPVGQFDFDLVVMDEASQMRPEDALGAIARGQQILIVGDPMQLGPTRFFDRLDAGDENEIPEDSPDGPEDSDAQPVCEQGPTPVASGVTVLERSESILLAAAACFPVRMLRWHYRSRHPRLIAFSNREFYHDRLIIFPTPTNGRASAGVVRHLFDDAVYVGRRNMREAEGVIAEVRRHVRECPEQSLLVATLNAEQADLIDGLAQILEKNDPAFKDFCAHHAGTQEPFTVKNLENVQGDERDRIMVSVTFGPNEAGQLRQNFGPINQAGGERRLNVLFTRAKHRLDVFHSFDPNNLRVSESSPRGLRVLRDYLRYASGELWWARGTETGRAPDSDFEIAVAMALQARGYEARAQVGVAGYFIDLAVVDPSKPGDFLLGIECDGATYHSAKSARDRDRLRQRQLESLGWTLHRIWSTDWFKDPDGQMERLVRRIEELRQQSEVV
ncbi:MAG: DUF4011 domain-containing protein [Gemmatimonadales bacterium]|nr:DUF4011 domain-containing protein [Gemmatimonadales bacterium]